MLTPCVCPALQHPEHDRLYLEDAFTSHNISQSALEVLLDTCLQNLPSGTHPPSIQLAILDCNLGIEVAYCQPCAALYSMLPLLGPHVVPSGPCCMPLLRHK